MLLVLILVLSANLLVAQETATPQAKSGTTKLPASTLPYDPAIVATAIRGSYYHPDDMSGLNCTISVDWPAFFSALKMNLAADRMKAIQNLKIQSQADRGKIPKVTFEWTTGALDNKEQFENGLKQVLGGFYQEYWSLVASSPISSASELAKVEPLSNGGVQVSISSQNTKVVIITDKDETPTHYTLDSPAMNGTIDLHYDSSPNPIPGDLRRVSSMDVSEQIGNSTMKINLSLDYQKVDEFYIPRHVSYNLSAAYSLSMNFSVCSVSKGAITKPSK
jgi:hypothetical protein